MKLMEKMIRISKKYIAISSIPDYLFELKKESEYVAGEDNFALSIIEHYLPIFMHAYIKISIFINRIIASWIYNGTGSIFIASYNAVADI